MNRLDQRVAMQLIARAKRKMRAERAAEIAELRVWFLAQLEEIREEMDDSRRELRAARDELERWQRGKDADDDAVSLH
jgi:hypothetical protein